MSTFENVNRGHVLQTLEEYDELGASRFLTTYGFTPANENLLWHEHRSYDSKAVLGVALRFATGTAAASDSFHGGEDGAAEVLRALDFEVSGDDDADGHWTEASDVGVELARAAWADAARGVLIGVAKRYRSVITFKELATEIQRLTGIRTKQPIHYWIGDVLGRVAAESASRDEPILSALAVNASGSVGDSYAIAIGAATGKTPEDPDTHAAAERLVCHQHFGAADLPDDGGKAALTANVQRTRDRERKERIAATPIPTCPRCHMAIPSTGLCDNCD